MKWTTPAFVFAPALVLAFAPAGFVAGQSSTSRLNELTPGPMAELLPADGSGTRSPQPAFHVIQPPGENRAEQRTGTMVENQLPRETTRATASQPATPRNSLINEPVPYSQAPQIQSGLYSLENTFTLPRTPVTTQPQPVFSQPLVQGGSVCACGSNELAPENCQCESCTGGATPTQFADECFSCQEMPAESCDPCNECESGPIIVDDCGCNECEGFGETVNSDEYFETHQQGFADGDVSGRSVKQGVISRHFQKHRDRNQQNPEYFDSSSAVCEIDGGECGVSLGDSAAVCGNAYQPVVSNSIERPLNPNDTRTNTLFNVSGVYFNRNSPDVLLSSQQIPGGGGQRQFLSTDDADHDGFGGIDASIIRRRGTGKGIELRYLSFTPGEVTGALSGSPVTLVDQFANIGQIGGLTHEQAFNLADTHEITRDMSIRSAEFNLLRMGRQASTRRGQRASFEYLLGFRYFNFEESLNYSGVGIGANNLAGGDITRADYRSEVENELYGIQFGGRSEISLLKRLSFLVGLKAGIFANDFSSTQTASVQGLNGSQRIAQVLDGPSTGSPFNFSGEDTDYTLLAELDLGLTYQLSNRIRVRGGYKAIFVDDVALADTQAAGDFRDIGFVSQPTVNDDLVLYGGYLGLDFAF